MVVYQTQSKINWLAIAPEGLSDVNRGPVSRWSSLALAQSILDATPRADVSAAITGHFGPNAPPSQDGVVYCAIMTRDGHTSEANFHLESPAPILATDWERRLARQEESAYRFLVWLEKMLP